MFAEDAKKKSKKELDKKIKFCLKQSAFQELNESTKHSAASRIIIPKQMKPKTIASNAKKKYDQIKLEEPREHYKDQDFKDVQRERDLLQSKKTTHGRDKADGKIMRAKEELKRAFTTSYQEKVDVEELYRLVKEKYSASRLEGFDLMLWGDLYVLFESDEEDEIWKSQHEYNLISWRLCDFCGIHILLMENGLAIHMLTEKKYPLSQEMISKMLKKKLEVDHESSQAIELLRFIRSQVQK
ncbi:hypothetical protein Tco_0775501 [Tanacetum coccineum]